MIDEEYAIFSQRRCCRLFGEWIELLGRCVCHARPLLRGIPTAQAYAVPRSMYVVRINMLYGVGTRGGQGARLGRGDWDFVRNSSEGAYVASACHIVDLSTS